MGICGTAMASLAGILKDKGFQVSGSDSNPYPPMSTQLEKLGIQIKTPYQAQNLNSRPDFVVVGNVISAHNPEAIELMKLQIPYSSLPKALGDLILKNHDTICVSGTHGKTTTTSMMSWVLEMAGKKPGFLIGGIPKNFNFSFRNPEKDAPYFVIEGDEYDTAFFDKVPKFVHYRPKHVILTSIEFDHADIYKDLDDVKAAFRRLLKLIPVNGSLIFHEQESNIKDLLDDTNTSHIYSYGFNKVTQDRHARCEVISVSEQGTEFRVHFKGKVLGPFKLLQPGDYNVLNATAVALQAYLLGVSMETVQKALNQFQGVKRRQEILGEPGGRLVIEDFAHHPTAVLETLKGLKKKYPQKKLIAIFEPRSATSRRKVFQKDYAQAFQVAQQVYLMQAFDTSKIPESDRFSVDELIQDLNKSKSQPWAQAHGNVESIVKHVQKESQSGDLIVIMSNGGFDGIYGKLMSALTVIT
ncbi:MAG: UDP-N-acetylmuramate:L-alanyl-gamma-D-glutamyl-meso-diaminopimelate ligase [Bdellovibrionaceae bacterium]|nr:UDP-N-acetylmuramate:L-alanyl-gamma-D-glutamyl-meso-diaminopimelate ligase [Pseudobdellovibrionaceae bacterium]